MKDNYLPNWNMPDFSHLTESIRKAQEMIRSVAAATLRTQELFRPIVEVVEQYKKQIASAFAGIAKLARPLNAIQIMGEAQFVYWDVLDSQLIDELIESNNPNKTLRAFVSKNKFAYVNNTIDKCINNHCILRAFVWSF